MIEYSSHSLWYWIQSRILSPHSSYDYWISVKFKVEYYPHSWYDIVISVKSEVISWAKLSDSRKMYKCTYLLGFGELLALYIGHHISENWYIGKEPVNFNCGVWTKWLTLSHINGLVQERRNSSALSCANPSIWHFHFAFCLKCH